MSKQKSIFLKTLEGLEILATKEHSFFKTFFRNKLLQDVCIL